MFKVVFALVISTLLLGGCNKEYVHVGPNWKAVHELKPSAENAFEVTGITEQNYKLGSEITVHVTSEKAGYVWLVHVDSNDKASVLFPNSAETDNRIKAGEKLSIPGEGQPYSLKAKDPKGPTVLAFIVTDKHTDLGDVIDGQNSMEKGLELASKSPAWGLDVKVVEVE